MRYATDNPRTVDPRVFGPRIELLHDLPIPGFDPKGKENSCATVIENLKANAETAEPNPENPECECPKGFNKIAVSFMPANGDPRGDDVHLDKYQCKPDLIGDPGWRRKPGNAPATNTAYNDGDRSFGEILTDPEKQPMTGYEHCGYLCIKK